MPSGFFLTEQKKPGRSPKATILYPRPSSSSLPSSSLFERSESDEQNNNSKQTNDNEEKTETKIKKIETTAATTNRRARVGVWGWTKRVVDVSYGGRTDRR